jgi:hypothetical protein
MYLAICARGGEPTQTYATKVDSTTPLPTFFGAADASFGDNVETRRSSAGFVFMLYSMPLTGKPLCFDQLPVLPLRQSFMLSLLPALNHNTGIDSAAMLALRFIPRRLSGVTMRRLYALLKATSIASKQSFATSISIKCGFAKR